MRAAKIIEDLQHLVDAGVILGFTRMGGNWLVHTRTLQFYFHTDEVEAFIAGAATARS